MPQDGNGAVEMKHLSMELKEIGPDGTFEGILASYNGVDLGGDMIEPGAFTKTLQEKGSKIPLLWQHRQDMPIGTLTLSDGDALHAKGNLLMELPDAQKAYVCIKAGVVQGLSIGYETLKRSFDGPVRKLKEIRLHEGSLVTIPMDPNAIVTSVKNWLGPEIIETKEGREISASNKKKLKAAHEHIAAAYEMIRPMCEEAGADEDTTSADNGQKSEPVMDHSAISSLITELKDGYKWNSSNS